MDGGQRRGGEGGEGVEVVEEVPIQGRGPPWVSVIVVGAGAGGHQLPLQHHGVEGQGGHQGGHGRLALQVLEGVLEGVLPGGDQRSWVHAGVDVGVGGVGVAVSGDVAVEVDGVGGLGRLELLPLGVAAAGGAGGVHGRHHADLVVGETLVLQLPVAALAGAPGGRALRGGGGAREGMGGVRGAPLFGGGQGHGGNPARLGARV